MPDTFDPALLSGYLDNELTTAETAVVKQALAHNAELRQELEDIRKLRAAIAALPLPPIQVNLVAGVRQRIEQQQVQRRSPMVHGAPATLKMLLSFAVAACVLLAVGWTILQNRTQPQTVALDPNSEPNSTQPPDRSLDQPLAESLPVADAMVAEAAVADAALADAALAEAMVESPRGDEKISMQAVLPPRESDPVEPLKSYGGATPPAPAPLQAQPQPRMMLKTGRQGPPPAMADNAPAPLSADFAPLAADAAPQLAEAAPQLADAAPLAVEQAPAMVPSVAPSMARSVAPSDTRHRMARGMVAPAEAAADEAAVTARPLQARFLLRRQLSEDPLANSARSVQSAAANAKPQLIVSTLRKDQLDAALRWWRDRVEVTPAARPQAALDPATQVLAVAGDANAVTKLSADWVRYVAQIHGQTRRQPLAVPPGAGMSKSATTEPGTPEPETPAADVPDSDVPESDVPESDASDVGAPDADDDRQATANGMLAIEFRIVE